jgi:NAD(P)-dependent dehydrogenase (short-subunit alcohol dehydrogenase family)
VSVMADTKNFFDLKSKTAIVTGGLGLLGSQHSKALLEAGAKVAVFDIGIDKLNDFFLKHKKNRSLRIYEVDITQKAQIQKALQDVIGGLGKPSILLNDAALDSPPGLSIDENGPFERYPEEAWDRTIEVNLKGIFLSCQVIGGYMAQNRIGNIINISSIYGNISPDQRIYEYTKQQGKVFIKPISYAVSKAGILNLTRYLATYWAKKNVRVNTLSLGGVLNKQDKRFIKEYVQRVPLGRMAKADEYNSAILFLASEASSYLTGSNIIIDGGFTAW